MIIPPGPSTPASQVPSMSATTPSSKLNTSSPRYQTAPPSACAYQSSATSAIRPSMYATYCDSTAVIPPSHEIILVVGSSVTSMRSGSPSSSPSSTADCSAGKSGLVIAVGSEKTGLTRSTLALSGAHPVPDTVPHTDIGGGFIGCGSSSPHPNTSTIASTLWFMP